MKTKKNKKGFTLAELLIVVAIIAVLVAIAIPVFTSQLEKSKQATDEANCRSAYGEAMATYLEHAGDSSPQTSGSVTLGSNTYNWNYDGTTMNVTGGAGKSSLYASGISYNGTGFGAGSAGG